MPVALERMEDDLLAWHRKLDDLAERIGMAELGGD
jgi:hypothetical protein